jgi:4-hydroxybutyrate dehydrogenase/sulfolactaldehyde 3-reductase
MEAIGFIGLGRMGRPMASNLCRKGFRLVVHDIDPHALSELELLQASRASTGAEVARRCQIVVTMLPDPTVVSEVIDAADGVIANANPGAVIMDVSTVDPATTERLAKKARARGLGYVDVRQAGQPC